MRNNTGDHMMAVTDHLSKLHPLSEKDKVTLEKVRKELEEGAVTLAERQKHIRIVHQSEHSWWQLI